MVKGLIAIFPFLTLMMSCGNKGGEQVISIEDKVAYQTTPDITEKDIRYHIKILASDSLEGRKAGTEGGKKAAEYIKNMFSVLNLSKYTDDYYMPFTFLPRKKEYNCELSFDHIRAVHKRDFISLVPVDSVVAAGEVIFVGDKSKKVNEKIVQNKFSDIDIKGKWVMFFEESDAKKKNSGLRGIDLDRYKDAQKAGAVGMLAINIDKQSAGRLVPLSYGYVRYDFTIPVIRISQKIADELLNYADTSTGELLKVTAEPANHRIYLPVTVKASVSQNNDSICTDNIVSYIEGIDPVLKDEYIIIGAHYDHLGKIEMYNMNFEKTDAIFNGADDNASGVAGLLELAEKLNFTDTLKRSIIFIAFSAEEEGLKGSSHIVNNLPVPLSKIRLMVNLDMIGRLDSCKLFVNTVESKMSHEKGLKEMERLYPDLKFIFFPNKKRNSDHYPFYEKKVPVVMLTTGFHNDIHTVNDTIGSINYSGEKEILDFVYDWIVSEVNKQ